MRRFIAWLMVPWRAGAAAGAMTGREIDEAMAVPADAPLLRAVCALLDARAQHHLELSGTPGLVADESKAEARCACALQEMEEILLERAEAALSLKGTVRR